MRHLYTCTQLSFSETIQNNLFIKEGIEELEITRDEYEDTHLLQFSYGELTLTRKRRGDGRRSRCSCHGNRLLRKKTTS